MSSLQMSNDFISDNMIIENFNHKFSINIPKKIYNALKAKAELEHASIKDIILFSIKESLSDNFTNLPEKEKETIISFNHSSNELFSMEWDSKEDEEAFSHLQKYKKDS